MNSVFVDTNILVSGVFFDGPEAALLDSRRLHLVTGEVCEHELKEVAARKSTDFGVSEDGAREMVDGALVDVEILPEDEYVDRYDEAAAVVGGGKDAEVLAAVLAAGPDYFVTGDTDFHTEEVEEIVDVVETRELLEKL